MIATTFRQSYSDNKPQTQLIAVRKRKFLVLSIDIVTMRRRQKELNEIVQSNLWNEDSHITNMKNYNRTMAKAIRL